MAIHYLISSSQRACSCTAVPCQDCYPQCWKPDQEKEWRAFPRSPRNTTQRETRWPRWEHRIISGGTTSSTGLQQTPASRGAQALYCNSTHHLQPHTECPHVSSSHSLHHSYTQASSSPIHLSFHTHPPHSPLRAATFCVCTGWQQVPSSLHHHSRVC